ncbi:MAG: hypothetical protein OXI86_07930, partial [Candidatus Poribacteria bacterium]|nr:hypothetical protein [Candidatus Poribacteria bacterium]
LSRSLSTRLIRWSAGGRCIFRSIDISLRWSAGGRCIFRAIDIAGISIALIIHSLDPSLSSRLIAPYKGQLVPDTAL